MTYRAVKAYEIYEHTAPGGWYRIEIKEPGRTELVDVILEPTMREARDKLVAKGYRRVTSYGE